MRERERESVCLRVRASLSALSAVCCGQSFHSRYDEAWALVVFNEIAELERDFPRSFHTTCTVVSRRFET